MDLKHIGTYCLLTCLVGLSCIAMINRAQPKTVAQTLIELGEKPAKHWIEQQQVELVASGKHLVTQGWTTLPDGSKSRRISKHFACIDCHNIEREDPVLSDSDPEARLDYCIENDLPFLPGTTLWGIVNRETWYNDDYQKKYGTLVEPARNDLKEAIQLCATECSQGRLLTDWEMEAVLHYLWSLELTMDDIQVNEPALRASNSMGGPIQSILLIKSKYLRASPAHFAEPLMDSLRNHGTNGDPESGAEIYQRSCMHCHHSGGVTEFTLDMLKTDLQSMANKSHGNGKQSAYNIIRKGTYALEGYKPYMPLYPYERMSNKQIEDLVAFFNSPMSE